MIREEEARKKREEDKKNALKLSTKYSEKHYESAMDKITKAATRSENPTFTHQSCRATHARAIGPYRMTSPSPEHPGRRCYSTCPCPSRHKLVRCCIFVYREIGRHRTYSKGFSFVIYRRLLFQGSEIWGGGERIENTVCALPPHDHGLACHIHERRTRDSSLENHVL